MPAEEGPALGEEAMSMLAAIGLALTPAAIILVVYAVRLERAHWRIGDDE